jgi:hypothetical protein
VLKGRLAPAVLTVNTAADEIAADSTLSLREAIGVGNNQSDANLSPAEQAQASGSLGSKDRIQFASSLNGQTITLTSGALTINRSLSIAGLSLADAAEALGISAATAKRYWVYARSWLYGKIHGQ